MTQVCNPSPGETEEGGWPGSRGDPVPKWGEGKEGKVEGGLHIKINHEGFSV